MRRAGIWAAELLELLPGYLGPRPLALGNATCDLVRRAPGELIFVEKALDRSVMSDEEGVELGAEIRAAGLRGPAWPARCCMNTF